MDRSLIVKTPESVAFSYDLAGLGSRFLAVTIDLVIQLLLLGAIIWALALAAASAPHPGIAAVASKSVQSVTTAIVVGLMFVIFFGYFIVFEAFWNGRTPGKRLMGLRVVRDAGYPLDLTSAVIRNLVRIGEFFLAFYAISAVACVLSRENKRLGDMAAGTIVVREAPIPALNNLVSVSEQVTRSGMLSAQEYALIDEFVARRSSLAPRVRARMAAQIATNVRSRVSYDLQQLPDDELLERLSAS
ncbi:MAG TPA: RDD family protein [Candidatus Baltobacteraceae bacterium]|jgi:uncharacterized RDD family membrane protein YckC|nr:RDD family protein [Candidatus Baltobacteraceae bacterium]